MKIIFVIVSVLASANSVFSTPAELTAQQDQLQTWVNDLIQTGNDFRQGLIEGVPVEVGMILDGFLSFEQDFLTGFLIHQGRRGKELAAQFRTISRKARRDIGYLTSFTRINQAMLRFYTDIIGPMIQEEYPLVAFQAAFEFDSAAAGACWTPVGDAVDAAIATYDTNIATLITDASTGAYYDSAEITALGLELMDYYASFSTIMDSCSSGETMEDDLRCVFDAIQAKLDNAESVFTAWGRVLIAALTLENATDDIITELGPILTAWDDNIGNYYDCIWALYEESIAIPA